MDKAYRYGIVITAIIGVVNFALIALVTALSSIFDVSTAVHWILLLLASFISATLVTYLIFTASPLLRSYLNTFRRLIRLESLSHPLLVKFAHAAPGTYNHSLAVANIASRAAKAVGANSLLTRIGAYYHDIGKIDSPDKFVENQSSKGNPHDVLQNPQQSAEIIISHVTNGVKIATDHRLPEEVIDFIKQHHGTGLVAYFYNKAKQENPNTNEADYRYLGPKPLTREAGILMLADTVEATARAHPNPSIDDLKRIIDEAIKQKATDHQLDLSGLTALQITKIRQSFLESLTAIFHRRIHYPESRRRRAQSNEPSDKIASTK